MNKKLIRKMQTAAGGPIKKPIKRLKDGHRYIKNETGGWTRITDDDMADVFATLEVTPSKTRTGSNISRTLSAPYSRYASAYNPDDVIKGFNALTLGGFNNLSPTQWARRIYDTGKLLNGDMTWSGYTNSWINGNNGLVSLKFSEEHPYLSAGINLAGDAIALGGISNPNSIKESLARGKGLIDLSKYGIYDRYQGYRLYNKYLKNNINNILNLLLDFRFDNGWIKTSDETGSLFLLPTTYTRSEVISSGPTSMRMGFTANPGGRLSRDLVSQGKEAISKLPTGTSISADAHGTSIPSRLSTRKGLNNITKTLFEGVEDSETTLSKMELLLGEEPGSFIRNPYDMSADAHRFFTLEAQKPGRQLVYAGRSGKWNNAAVSNPEIYLWQQAYESGTLSARDYVNNYNNWVKGFGGRPGHVDINGKPYFYHPTIFITHKQGGKMNIIEFLKNGSGIHIKKENKGKFTSWCGGKVTSECIAKGKASSNPTIRKRATFADNARHFKHQEGGNIVDKFLDTIILSESGIPSSLLLRSSKLHGRKQGGILTALNGTKFLSKEWFKNTSGKVLDFFKSDSAKVAINGAKNLYGMYKNSKAASDYNNSYDAETEANVQAMNALLRADNYQKGLQMAEEEIARRTQSDPSIHYGNIDKLQMAMLFASGMFDSNKETAYRALRAKEKKNFSPVNSASFSGLIEDLGSLATLNINGTPSTNNVGTTNGTTFKTDSFWKIPSYTSYLDTVNKDKFTLSGGVK